MEIIREAKLPIYTWAPWYDIEEEAQKQIREVANLPWIDHHVAVMPDVHAGKGATIGTVIVSTSALMPSAVGVDLACGMSAVATSLNREDLKDLPGLRQAIEAKIPVGFNKHQKPIVKEAALDGYQNLQVSDEFFDTALRQLGTLGGGNHFIEISVNNDDEVWIMLHSGSRRIGKEIADFHINIAKSLTINNWCGDLSRLVKGSVAFDDYLKDVHWAQNYAQLNRDLLLSQIALVLTQEVGKFNTGVPIKCHHNFVEEVDFYKDHLYVTRKGAINAESGVLAIIPGSMGTASYIVEGFGNSDSFWSASHGAGRKMSRSKAKKTFTVADIEEQLAGVESRRDSGILDELPGAYKDVEVVMEQQQDLVKPLVELHQLISIKG